MIKNIIVTNHLGESVTMELRFPEKSGFLVRGIEGLGPSKANINTTEVLSSDGSIYNSARVNSRNIVFSLGLMALPRVEDTRQKSYKYFPIKKRIEMVFETDNRLCATYGYIETNEPTIFSSDEITSISVICPDAYFYSLDTNVTLFSGINPAFEFPFENPSFTSPLMEMGTVITSTQKSVLYEGDASVGLTIFIHAIGPVQNLRITNTNTREYMRIDTVKLATLTGYGIIAGDDIIISTIKGNKFVYLQRNGVLTNILNCLDKNADWFQLERGDNLFSYIADYGITNLQFRIENQTVYEGV